MIRENDLDEAIAECMGERTPNAQTCIKLAAFLTIKEHLYGAKTIPSVDSPDVSYSYSSGNDSDEIDFDGETEFAKIINRKKLSAVLPVLEEIIETIRIVNPKLYNAAIRKLSE